nr:hypothetical protein [uncultured Rhodopila sp.]
MSNLPKSVRRSPRRFGLLTVLVWLACGQARAELPPTTEFDSPYQLRVESNGTVLEISGSFSWAVPQNVQAVLASEPGVRTVRLESPGGHLQPALEVANIIQQRGLDTYVGRLCASACTIAFLGGRQRWLAPDARLGFHQAYAPGFPSEEVNAFLKRAYEKFAIPPGFVAHVLRIGHTDIWYPAQEELRAVGYTTGAPPSEMLALGGSPFPRLTDITRSLRSTPDVAVIGFAEDLAGLLRQLQEANPEACWAFTHEEPDDTRNALPGTMLDAIAAARKRLAVSAKSSPVRIPDPDQRKKATAELLAAMRTKGQAAALTGLRAGADHAAFCPSVHELLQAALALPDPDRVLALRAVLWGG